MSEVKQEKEEGKSVKGTWAIRYRWRFNTTYMEKYANAMKEKKIIGTKCHKCGRVFVPPANICGRCLVELKDWVEVKGDAELIAYTVGYSAITGQKLEQPRIIGMIKYEGADSWTLAPIQGIDPEALKIGMKLKPVWRKEPKGQIGDIEYFEPA